MRQFPLLGHAVLATALCSLLAACGSGGGGGGGGSGAAVGGGGGVASTAGTRAVPGFAVTATRLSPLQAGQPCTIRLHISPEAGQPALQALAGWLGTGTYGAPATTIEATPVAGVADTWQVVVTVAEPLPGDATLWLRLTAVDGSVMEVGRGAFEVAGIPGG